MLPWKQTLFPLFELQQNKLYQSVAGNAGFVRNAYIATFSTVTLKDGTLQSVSMIEKTMLTTHD